MTVEVNNSINAGRSRYLYPAFIASLALNLLFVGSFAAAVWHHRHGPKGPGPDNGFLGFVDTLTPDRQEPIRQQVVAARESMKDLRAQVRTTWLAANALLTAEPFDKEKFLAALMQLRDAEDRFKTAIYNIVANTAGELTPDERKLLQKWREKRHEKILAPPPDQPKPDGKSD